MLTITQKILLQDQSIQRNIHVNFEQSFTDSYTAGPAVTVTHYGTVTKTGTLIIDFADTESAQFEQYFATSGSHQLKNACSDVYCLQELENSLETLIKPPI